MIKYRLFRFGFWLGPYVPRPMAGAIATLVGYLLWLLKPSIRRQVRANLAHIPTLAANPQRLDGTVRAAFVQLMLNYVDLFAPLTLTKANIFEHFDVANPALLQEIHDRGKGMIMITHHASTFELAKFGVRLLMDGAVVVPAEPVQPPELFALMCQQRGQCGFDFLDVAQASTLRDMLATLRAGNTILVAVDRDIMQSGIDVPLFNGTIRLPIGVIALARRTGAPIVWISAERDAIDHFHAFIVPLDVPISAEARDDDAMRRALAPIATQMEAMIRRHPEQWLAVFADDVWVQDDAFATPRSFEG